MSQRFARTLLLLTSLPASAAQILLNDKTFTLPDGFTIELVAGPPLVDRPIVADFDERGRLYVADSSGTRDPVQKQLADRPHRILRLEDTNGDGVFDKTVVFADKMMFPEGAMWLDGSLYVSAPPSIWKLTDTNNDGVADERVEWFQGKTLTGCANDLHGPYLGPDGWVYWCKGAFAKQTYNLPNRKPLVTRAAHVFRARPDGRGVEPVMTGGMDNPIDVVFSAGGERFVSATFITQPAAGKRDGLIHAVYGGVYGKIHDVIDDAVRTSPDVMPVLSHLGPSASCGLARYESDAFGESYKDNLFSASFNLHKIFRHTLKPAGATFTSDDTDFLTCDSPDFHPTDVIADADGSLLIIDTGGWYKLCCPTSALVKPQTLGAIYRVRRTAAPPMADPRGLKLDWNGMGPGELTALLDDARPAVRNRALATLAARGLTSISELDRTVTRSEAPVARLNAVWAATRIDHAAARMIVRAALRDDDETVRQAAAHSAGLWRDGLAIYELSKLLDRNKFPQNQRAAAEALGRIGGSGSVSMLLSQIGRGNDKVLEHSLTYALIEINQPKPTAEGLAATRSPAVRRATMIALDQMEKGGLDAADVLKELTSTDTATRDTATWIASRHPEWDDAILAALGDRLTHDAAGGNRGQLQSQLTQLAKASKGVQALLAARVADPAAPAPQRKLALAAMADSGLREVPPAWFSAIAKVLEGPDLPAAEAAAATVRKLAVPAKSADVIASLARAGARKDLSAQARMDALAAIPAAAGNLTLDPEAVAFLMAQAAPNQPAARRLAAAEAIGRAKLSNEQLTALTSAIAKAGPMEIDRLLGAFAGAADPAVGAKLVAALRDAKALSSVRPDALRKRLEKFPPDVQKSADELLAKLNPDAAKQGARVDEMLAKIAGGDVSRGQAIFASQKAACIACHSIGYVGGKVGPDLTKIGAIRSERDLLEAILYPSASFVQSFEPVIVETRDGDVHNGVLRRNDADEVLIVTGPEQEIRIPRNNVKDMRPGAVSIMPAGLDQALTPAELADLVTFLRACK